MQGEAGQEVLEHIKCGRTISDINLGAIQVEDVTYFESCSQLVGRMLPYAERCLTVCREESKGNDYSSNFPSLKRKLGLFVITKLYLYVCSWFHV
jgi:hypothetical protein